MDQVKEFLRQCIKYRFWIAVGISALLPMIGYFMGVPSVRADAEKITGEIKKAEKDVKLYTAPGLPNAQYKPIVNEKTQAVAQDVKTSWKKLYARQAPLLTWPEVVDPTIKAWGRKWPENIDSSTVLGAIVAYMEAYPAEVDKVYKSFKPFDYEEGTGVVAADPKETLLRPATFKPEEPPSLGKVWAAQERLWIQRTLLDVVANVNGDAKSWDQAYIKRIVGLEVGTALAQDQRSVAKGETLEEAVAIDDPAKPAEPAPEAGGPAGMEGMMKMMNSGGAAKGVAPETVSHIKPENPDAPYTIMPVQLTVLIDQEHVQDLLVAMENSPMTIQVRDFELTKPTARITKPEKGQQQMGGYGGMMGGMGGSMMMMMRMMNGGRGASGYGGNSMQIQQNMMMSMMGSGMMGGGGLGAARPPRRKAWTSARKTAPRKRSSERKRPRTCTATRFTTPITTSCR